MQWKKIIINQRKGLTSDRGWRDGQGKPFWGGRTWMEMKGITEPALWLSARRILQAEETASTKSRVRQREGRVLFEDASVVEYPDGLRQGKWSQKKNVGCRHSKNSKKMGWDRWPEPPLTTDDRRQIARQWWWVRVMSQAGKRMRSARGRHAAKRLCQNSKQAQWGNAGRQESR